MTYITLMFISILILVRGMVHL